MQKFVAHSEQETLKFAQQFAKSLRKGEVVLLLGDLGSGKTTFVKGLAQAFGVKEKITSPTFVLTHVHKIRNSSKFVIQNLIHVDAYRLKTAQALLDIGLGDWLGRPDTLVLIEWGEKIRPFLRRQKIKFIEIKFEHGKKENERILQLDTMSSPPRKMRWKSKNQF